MVLMQFAKDGTAVIRPGDAVTLEAPAGARVDTAVIDMGLGRFAKPDTLVLQLGTSVVEAMVPPGTKVWVEARVQQS